MRVRVVKPIYLDYLVKPVGEILELETQFALSLIASGHVVSERESSIEVETEPEADRAVASEARKPKGRRRY